MKRATSALLYLRDVASDAGGATHFPALNLTIQPKTGTLVLWYNYRSDGRLDERSEHASLPLLLGEKFVLTLFADLPDSSCAVSL
jgi:prolyl 4-hydroxylase